MKAPWSGWLGFGAAIGVCVALVLSLAVPSLAVAAPPASMTGVRPLVAPRAHGRLDAASIGLVVNSADPYSVAVGAFYAAERHLRPEQVLQVQLPVRATLTPQEFAAFAERIAGHFDGRIQALALAWSAPYAVECNSITGALALGYDGDLCSHSCAASHPSPYFNSASGAPFTDLHLRPSMLLAAPDIAAAKAMIARGVAADDTLGLRGAPTVNALYVTTDDAVRGVRARLFPPAGLLRSLNLTVQVLPHNAVERPARVLVYEIGAVNVEGIDQIGWVPGALADHLTSFGGQLDGRSGQMSAMAWIAAGATASYGTVSEPCAHPEKFPHPQALLLHYAQGETAIEAYWKSVAWPQQGVFIGEPLATPYARRMTAMN